MTRAEEYFLEQARPHLAAGEAVEASGYFRAVIKPTWGGAVGAFKAAAQARGYYLALTPNQLIVVETPASGTRSPVLKNTGVRTIPRGALTGLEFRPNHYDIQTNGVIRLHAAGETLALEPWVKNKAFPRQGQLLELLNRQGGGTLTAEALARAVRQKFLVRLIGIAIFVAIGASVAIFTRR